MRSLGLAVLFLQNALMAENTLKFLEFHPIPIIVTDGDIAPQNQKYMILDSQAIEHLDLLQEKNSDGKPSYCLFDFIDHCSTPFGRRLLKKWMLSPLMDIDSLNERYDSVEDLISHKHELDHLRKRLEKLPDMERMMSKVFTYSVRTSVKAVYFENVSF